jgi:hypothetical protein
MQDVEDDNRGVFVSEGCGVTDLENWLTTFVNGRRSSPRSAEGKIVWLLDDSTGTRRVCAVLSPRGCRLGGDEPADTSKLLIQGEAASMTAYLQTADATQLAALQFRGDARLWETLIEVASQRRSAIALRAELATQT